MPANAKHIAWNMRIDDPPDRTPGPEFWKFVDSPGIFCCYELGDNVETPNPHWHIACVFKEPTSKQTLSNQLKRLLPNHLPGDRAVVPWKGYGTPDDKWLQYLSKGPDKDTPPNIRFNRTLLNPKELQVAYWAVNASHREKCKEMPLCQRVYEALRERLKDASNFDEKADMIYEEVMKQTAGRINDNIAWPHIQWVMYRVDPQSVSESFRDRMRKKWGQEKYFS